MVSVSWLCFPLPFCITKCPRHKESPSQSNVYKQEEPGKEISVEYNLFSNSKNPFNGDPCQGLWNVHQSNLNQLCEMFQDIQDGISEVLILILPNSDMESQSTGGLQQGWARSLIGWGPPLLCQEGFWVISRLRRKFFIIDGWRKDGGWVQSSTITNNTFENWLQRHSRLQKQNQGKQGIYKDRWRVLKVVEDLK